MTNLLEQAINCSDGDRAAKIIRDALGLESDDVASYCFPKEWPTNREQRASRRRPACFVVRDHNGQALAYGARRCGALLFRLYHISTGWISGRRNL